MTRVARCTPPNPEAAALTDLMSIRQAVEAVGESPTPEACQRMRRRMELIDARAGGKILRTLEGRRQSGCKLWISKAALMCELRTDYARHDTELSGLRCQLEGVERRLSGLGRAHRKLGRRVTDFQDRQEKINHLSTAAIQAVETLAHTVAERQT